MKSIFYQNTGRVIRDESEMATLKSDEIVRDNAILAPVEMNDRRISRKQQTIWKNGRQDDGFDRNNAVGDVRQPATRSPSTP